MKSTASEPGLRQLPSIAFPMKASHTLYLLQVKIKFKLMFLTWVDSQFPLSPIPNYS